MGRMGKCGWGGFVPSARGDAIVSPRFNGVIEVSIFVAQSIPQYGPLRQEELRYQPA